MLVEGVGPWGRPGRLLRPRLAGNGSEREEGVRVLGRGRGRLRGGSKGLGAGREREGMWGLVWVGREGWCEVAVWMLGRVPEGPPREDTCGCGAAFSRVWWLGSPSGNST